MSKKHKMADEDYPTTGHEWDGIREYDKPMPRWWLWTFFATIIFSLAYVIAYPAVPLIKGATPGLLGYSSRAQLQRSLDSVALENAEIEQLLLATPLENIAKNPSLVRYASAGGGAVFRTYCAQCHGAGAQGATGYPNLQDDDWLWGGDLAALEQTIQHGIRSDADEDTRYSEMPKFGEFLEEAQIEQLVEYLRQISGQDYLAETSANAEVLFADNCAACHGQNGEGNHEQGAPNLKDALWLYGGDRDALRHSIANARFGVMPAWNTRITPAQIRQVTFYVHQLGGGE
ncbi:Cbb3-type cytochrome c oxidase subunit CcoP [Amylibacter marinus]|uniref:Cbb3-type cytochrome c oxidase subunit n=1 Tax=Amylibacter marinus TaxID=1475483 RepID=A0ABQ5VXX5_9RHOB|nr:cytochrome-c oxidase, cbb3-type subunit III [Amylibacter marinus]GLQ36286.1 Cbb3-type cytochrome c oxidase subunit CcoP [Amylibacter marinus]